MHIRYRYGSLLGPYSSLVDGTTWYGRYVPRFKKKITIDGLAEYVKEELGT